MNNLFLLFVALWVFAVPAGAALYSGGGTAEDPYLIDTPAKMNDIGNNPGHWAGYFELTADIDLSAYMGEQFNLIGYYLESDVNSPFTGVFDGNDHTISNFGYSTSCAETIGIFAYAEGAEIKDVGLIYPDVVYSGTSDYYLGVGSLVGLMRGGTVTNCYVEGGSVAGGLRVGGLVGRNEGTISDSHAEGDVWGYKVVGGLVGSDSNVAVITNCCSIGSVSGAMGIGGLVGSHVGTITDSYSMCSVSGDEWLGGLTGGSLGLPTAIIADCYATGNVIGSGGPVGGLSGYTEYGVTITGSYATGDVSGDMCVGGLVGGDNHNLAGCLVMNCYATGRVSGGSSVGGLVGAYDNPIINCYATGEVSGDNWPGGLMGTGAGPVQDCFWDIETGGPDNGYGTPLGTADMQDANTFLDAGWDFNTPIWTMCCHGGNYPRLSWEEPRVYHVNVVDGNDENSGLTGETAFATIRAGINAAYGCEEVLVWPGVYTEELDFLGKPITVKGTTEPAVLSASAFYAVWFHSGEDANSIFKNFIMKDSYAAFYVFAGSPTIENVTVVDNENGVMAEGGANPDISNCIFWNNSSLDLYQCQARYSCIEGGSEGIGNISEDPRFVDPNNGDYHLRSEGWRWSQYESKWIYDDVTSRCVDSGNPGTPLGDELMSVPRDPGNVYGVNLRVNIGAYGGMAQASMALHGWALLADLNNDGVVNYADLGGQAEDWLSTASEQPGDLNRDSVVNMKDFALLAEEWLQETDWAQ